MLCSQRPDSMCSSAPYQQSSMTLADPGHLLAARFPQMTASGGNKLTHACSLETGKGSGSKYHNLRDQRPEEQLAGEGGKLWVGARGGLGGSGQEQCHETPGMMQAKQETNR